MGIDPCAHEGLDQQLHEELETNFEVDPGGPTAITVLPDTEKHVYDARSGKELPRDLVRKGRETEIEELRQHGVFEEVQASESQGKVVRFEWVEDLRTKDGIPFVRSRGVAMEIDVHGREDCNAGAPPIAIVRAIVSLAATKRGRRHLSVHGVRAAFFHADLDEKVVVIPPPGLRRIGVVWQLRKAMYGTQSWQEYVTGVFEKNGWTRIAVATGVYYEPHLDMTAAIYGGDILTEGDKESLDILDQQFAASLDVKCAGRVGPDGVQELQYLNRKVRWTGTGFAWIGDTKPIAKCVELLDLTGCMPVDTLERKATGPSFFQEALEPLTQDEAELYRRVARLVSYVAVDRPDIQFAVKTILTDMERPSLLSMLRLRRCVRYLHGRRELGWFYERQEMPRDVIYETDSDRAENKITGKSTSSVYGFFGEHLLEARVTSQPAVALSSGEVDLYAIGRGATSAIMRRLFYQQCGIEVVARVHSDSNADMAIATLIGSERVRHFQMRDLEERVRLGELQLGRVSADDNRSRLGTRHLDNKRLLKLLEMSNLRLLTKGLAAGVGVTCITFADAAEHGNEQCSGVADRETETDATFVGLVVFAMIGFIVVAVLLVKGAFECMRGTVVLVSPGAARAAPQPVAAKAAPQTDSTAKLTVTAKDSPGEQVVPRAAARAAPGRGAEARSNLGSEYFGKMLAEATVAELKEELRWRKLPVSGLKADLIIRLTRDGGQYLASSEGLAAAAWAERLAPGKVPIQAFRSDASLGSYIGSLLSSTE